MKRILHNDPASASRRRSASSVQRRLGAALGLSLVFCVALVTAAQPSPVESSASPDAAAKDPLGHVADFSLPSAGSDQTLKQVSMGASDRADFTVLCFLGTECPLAKVYGPRLQSLADQFASSGVAFIGVNSNIQDSVDEIRQYAADHGVSFPIAKDHDRRVALDAMATRTPEVVVVDRVGRVQYRGRIDDQYQPGIARSEATVHDLQDAIGALVDGRPVANPRTTAVGCLISLPKPTGQQEQGVAPVTYCDQISRVLKRHCVECHREGEIGPFALDDYDEVLGWGDMSIEVIDQGRMPPWHAADGHAELANARLMPESDKQLLRQWVDAGMPYGDVADLPEPTSYIAGWQLPRDPDLVLAMSKVPFEIPASDTVEYQYYVVDTGFKTDRWVQAAEVIPGNRAAVHHSIAFVRPPDGADLSQIGLLSAYVPGQRRSPLPTGYAQRIPAGSRIVFQMHYTPTGKPESDITKIGLVFADADSVTHEVISMGGIEQDFEIPPHTADYLVEGRINGFPRSGELLSIMPHMHLRGKSFRFFSETAGAKQTVLDVPHYDFNWQHNYQLSQPLPLADVQRLSFAATFDNSDHNPFNPDPQEYVTWGDQTWQEMAVTFINVAIPLKGTSDSDPTPSDQSAKQAAQQRKENQQRKDEAFAKADKFAESYFQRFDHNSDGFIVKDELPHSVRIFSFGQFDHDRDQRISRDEIRTEAAQRFD